MGEAPPKIPSTAATKKAVETVKMVITHQQKYWRCLFPKDLSRGMPLWQSILTVLTFVDFEDILDSEKLHGETITPFTE